MKANSKQRAEAGMASMKKNRRNTLLILTAALLLTAALAWGAYLAISHGLLEKTISLISTDLSSPLFIALMVVLPMLGFPMSIFLVVAGLKFGVVYGFVLWLLVLPLHTLTAYGAATYLRPLLEKLLNRTLGYSIPTIPSHNEAMVSFLFLAIPAGIPYAVKNYLLPMAGVSIWYCVPLNCLVQGVLGAPYIILGKSVASMDLTLLYIAVIVFLLLFLGLRWLSKTHRRRK